MRRLVALFAGGIGVVAAQAVPSTNGLYAVVTSSKGTFYCYLNYSQVPRTVANFVSLADGTKDWLDYSRATVVHRPFFDNIIFHRVISNFVIQAGSPNGMGTDDPGYQFRDEFSPQLRHNRAGILSMANSGTNSNGSQFFITLAPTPWLDDLHSVFGSVAEGMSVVNAIGAVPTDANDRPVQPVVIESIRILRIGTAASNFVAGAVAPALPVPRRKVPTLEHQAPNWVLHWPATVGNDYRVCFTPDFLLWDGARIGPYSGIYVDNFVNSVPFQFFSVFESKID